MSTSPGAEVPSHRACTHCRSHKVRCIPDDTDPDVCQRCARSKRPCIFAPAQKRKQRKRTDTRVAELEREMRAMRSMLKKKQDGVTATEEVPSGGSLSGRPAGLWFEENALGAPREAAWEQEQSGSNKIDAVDLAPSAPAAGRQLWPTGLLNRSVAGEQDAVEQGILSMSMARQLFDAYRQDLFPHYPTVPVLDSTSADEMRRTKPTLFLAMIAASAGKESSELSSALDQVVLHVYATRSLVHSEKSLELVQALLISAVWYHPPSRFGQLKYYEYIHMAATMAMDIGIGTRPTPHRSRFRPNGQGNAETRVAVHFAEDPLNPDMSMTPRSLNVSFDTGDLESRRTFLACYIVCASVSISLRRPNMLRASSYVKECINFLDQSPNTLSTDRTLAAWARLVMIGDEVNTSFSYDDPGGLASIADLRTQLMLADFEKRLTNWFASVPPADLNVPLAIMYHTIRLYLHELALHVDHSPEDFKAPYQMGVVQPYHGDEIPTQVLARAIAECVASSHSIINTFVTTDATKLRGLPIFSYVRVSFAAFVLTKLCLSVAHPDSRIGQVLDRSSLKVEACMDKLILHVRDIIGPNKCRVPAILLALLFKLRQWCTYPEMIAETQDVDVSERSAQSLSDAGLTQARKASTSESSVVAEQSSSDHNSPHALNRAQQLRSENRKISAATSPGWGTGKLATTGLTPTASGFNINPFANASQFQDPSLATMTGTANRVSAAGAIDAQTDPYTGGFADPMPIDDDLLQLWDDMNRGLPEGGLTGLGDWDSLPTDVVGFGPVNNAFSWQPPTTASGGPATGDAL